MYQAQASLALTTAICMVVATAASGQVLKPEAWQNRPPGSVSKNLLPENPKGSLLPLVPGSAWIYQLEVKGETKCMRWYTKDFRSCEGGFAILGLHQPAISMDPGVYRIRYSVSEERKTFSGPRFKGSFFKIDVEKPDSGEKLTGDETLYWGRCRYGGPTDLTLCEVRTIGAAGRQLLQVPAGTALGEELPDFREIVHFRLLSGEIFMDYPNKKAALVDLEAESVWGSKHVGKFGVTDDRRLLVSFFGRWKCKSATTVEPIEVPAGRFVTRLTTFDFDFNGHVRRKVTERLHFSPGVGLVKWVQSENDEETFVCQLVSFQISAGKPRNR